MSPVDNANLPSMNSNLYNIYEVFGMNSKNAQEKFNTIVFISKIDQS